MKNGAPIGDPLTGHTNQVRSVAFNPREDLNGTMLASTGKDAQVFLWNIETRQPVTQAQLAASGMNLAFSPDGRRLAVGKEDGTIDLRDADSLKLLRPPLQGHTGPVLSLAFSDDGATLYSGGQDSRIIRWNSATGAMENEKKADGQVVVLSTVSGYLASGYEHFDGLDLRNGQTLEAEQAVPVPPRGRPLAAEFDLDPYGNTTLIYADSNNDLAEWDSQQNTVKQPLLGYEGPSDSAAFMRSGQGTDGLAYATSLNGTILVWATDPEGRAPVGGLSATGIAGLPDGASAFRPGDP